MDKKLYHDIFEMEEKHWWFVGRRRIIAGELGRIIPIGIKSALDIGCGTGFNVQLLQNRVEKIAGLEISPEAIRMAAERMPDLKVMQGEFPNVKLDEKFDLITLYDVLEHFADDKSALKKVSSFLNPGGYVVLTVPAFSFLWSEHDRINHHKRRYTKKMLTQRLSESGFEISRVTYFNAMFFLPIVLFRAVHNLCGFRRGFSDFFMVPKSLNNFLGMLFGAERWLIRFLNLPFGVSLLGVARKVPPAEKPSLV